MRLNALAQAESGKIENELREYYHVMWRNLPLECRLHFVISEPQSRLLWAQEAQEKSIESYRRDREYVVELVIEMIDQLNIEYDKVDDVGPTRLIDIAPHLVTSGINLETDPAEIQDEHLLADFLIAKEVLETNLLQQHKYDHYSNLKSIMDDAVPAFIMQAYTNAPSQELNRLFEILINKRLDYGRWKVIYSLANDAPSP